MRGVWSINYRIAEYSVVKKDVYERTLFFYNRMLWDDRFGVWRGSHAGDRRSESQTPSFPVAIGAGSHPFPFRTRKLSLLPPMVLPAQVGGRVGRCRGFNRWSERPSPSPSEKSPGLFLCTRDGDAADVA